MTPRQRQLIRKATRVRPADPSETSSELNIVPFLDVVVNLMLFLLATSAATMVLAQAEIESPSTCSSHCAPHESIDLNVTLTHSGVIVASRGGVVQPGCDAVGAASGPTIPLQHGQHDFTNLARCLETIRAQYPDETTVTLTAEPEIHYELVIGALDAIRPSFERTQLAAGVR